MGSPFFNSYIRRTTKNNTPIFRLKKTVFKKTASKVLTKQYFVLLSLCALQL